MERRDHHEDVRIAVERDRKLKAEQERRNMHMNDYQEATSATAIYPKDKGLEYLALGLVSEAGEVAGKVKKFLRGDYDELPRGDLEKEMGDVLWYLAQLCELMGLKMGDAAYFNLEKLLERKKNNTLQGDGDNR